ncbi:MAG: VWA domain-containing protein [Holophagales bacterium]|nr:VWA domain-containing protein [Holophagales bacterium]
MLRIGLASELWLLSLLGLFSLTGPAAPGHAGEHVRVVLDVSKSMRKTDPGGLAKLSTVLLYDLANPDLSLDDSFEVLPFHPSRKWTSPRDPPPREIGRRLRPSDAGRSAFATAIRGLGYDADWTYFYPGLRSAIEDLEGTPLDSDVRVVVIVTDGLPEAPTRAEEAGRIRAELQPRMVSSRIWLYVLAFGSEASANRDFFERLVRTDAGETLGEVFVDATGDGLLGHMLELFSHAFGYTQDPPRPVALRVPVDLEGGTTPASAVAVVYTPDPAPPSLRLTAPAAAPRPPTSPDGVETASDAGASYALEWVLSPHPGEHELRTDARVGTVAVLRPTRLRLEVRPPAGAQALRTMAATPLPLEILVSPPGGAQGDPGEVQLAFRPHGPRTGSDPETGASLYAWDGREGAPPSGPSKRVAEGRVYAIEAVFEREPPPEEPFYAGYLEVEARRGAALVGALAGIEAHRVEVFPRVRIVPSPGLGDAVARGSGGGTPRALEQGERG